MEKAPIKKFAMEARRKLMDDVRSQLGRYGITANGILDPHTVTENELIIDLGNGSSQRVRGKQAIAQYRNLVAKAREFFTADKPQQAIDNFCEEWAYTWFNRLIAIRFMEVNRYIPVRVLSSEISDQNVPDLVKSPFSGDLEYTAEEKQQLYALLDADSKEDDIFRFVFFKQCNDLNRILPRLFENLDGEGSFSQLLVVLSFNDPNGVVYRLVNGIEEKWFDIHAKDENGSPMGQIQIIGWMYQYYNAEPKDAVFAALKKNVKITKENIPAATQLFTPDWIVRYMVENSLGRLWSEGHPGFDKSEWKYYLDEAQQEPQVEQQLAEIRAQYANLEPEQIKVIDPCMGSGHILCYLFDVLMQIYLEGGYSKREAVRSILENNLFGLEIDKRAAQIAYFAVMMKAREYDSGFFTRSKVPQPKVYEILESNGINRSQLKFFGNGLSDFERNEAQLQLEGILDTLTDAKEYGSILNMGSYNWELLRSCAEAAGEDAQVSMESIGLEDTVNQLKPLIEIAEAMGQKYDVVVTNPPYMGANGMNPELSLYVKNKFPDSKSDLFACFIEHGLVMTKKAGFSCMVTMQSWMFLSSLERMRTNILRNRNICTLLQMGNGVMGIAFGTAATSIRNWNISGYAGVYTKVVSEDVEGNKPRKFPANNVYTRNQESFDNIPGHSISYWVSDASASAFDGDTLASYATTRLGMSTADNDRFMRNWQEVSVEKIGFCCINSAQAIEQHYKWFPYNKGGSFRKWYGNNDYVVNWENDGSEIRAFKDPKTGRIRSHNYNAEYAFRESLTWSDISSAHNFGIRYSPQGKLFDGRGSSLFTKTEYIHNIHAYLCSCVAAHFLSIINQTMVFNVGDVIQVPFKSEILSNDDVRKLSENCVSLSKSDWDSFETSWDFEEHPLV